MRVKNKYTVLVESVPANRRIFCLRETFNATLGRALASFWGNLFVVCCWCRCVSNLRKKCQRKKKQPICRQTRFDFNFWGEWWGDDFLWKRSWWKQLVPRFVSSGFVELNVLVTVRLCATRRSVTAQLCHFFQVWSLDVGCFTRWNEWFSSKNNGRSIMLKAETCEEFFFCSPWKKSVTKRVHFNRKSRMINKKKQTWRCTEQEQSELQHYKRQANNWDGYSEPKSHPGGPMTSLSPPPPRMADLTSESPAQGIHGELKIGPPRALTWLTKDLPRGGGQFPPILEGNNTAPYCCSNCKLCRNIPWGSPCFRLWRGDHPLFSAAKRGDAVAQNLAGELAFLRAPAHQVFWTCSRFPEFFCALPIFANLQYFSRFPCFKYPPK